MKIIHFADFHLGIDTIGPMDPSTRLNGRVLDYLDALDAMIEFAIDNDVDVVLFAGDAFNKHNPDPTYLREFGERIVRLSDQCPVILLPGNHDSTGSAEKASSITLFDTLRVPNVVIGMNYEMLDVETKHGMLQVATVPYPFKNRILSANETRGRSREKIEELYRKKVGGIIRDLGRQIDESYPAILLAHLSVDTATWGSERNIEIGVSSQTSLETLISDPWDYVALGHIHLYQNLTGDMEGEPPVIYSGSMERVDFGEEFDDKGFVFIDIGKETKYEFIQVDARPYVTIEANCVGKLHPTEYVLSRISKANIKSAVVRVLIHIEHGNSSQIRQRDVTEAVMDSGAYCVYSVTIKTENLVNDVRLGTGLDVVGTPHEDLLEAYFSMREYKPRDVKQLMSLASEIMGEVNSERRS